jgi:hypothetical protein
MNSITIKIYFRYHNINSFYEYQFFNYLKNQLFIIIYLIMGSGFKYFLIMTFLNIFMLLHDLIFIFRFQYFLSIKISTFLILIFHLLLFKNKLY